MQQACDQVSGGKTGEYPWPRLQTIPIVEKKPRGISWVHLKQTSLINTIRSVMSPSMMPRGIHQKSDYYLKLNKVAILC